MDGDSGDAGGCINEVLVGGDVKPDKLLSAANIIKQDVMLSGTNNQSPIPPVLSFSTSSFNQAVSNQPNIAVALTDNLFSALQQSNDGTKDTSNQTSLLTANIQNLAPTLLTQQQQTNQMAQQLLLANQATLGLPNAAGTSSVPHLLIPVSAGNLSQQLVSIPISLGNTGLNNQMLLTASNGQLMTANMAGLAPQPLTLALQPSNNGSLQPVFMLGSQLGVLMPQIQNQNFQNIALRQLAQQQQQQISNGSNTVDATNATVVNASTLLSPNNANLTQLIANAQGQIVAIGNPQLLQQTLAAMAGSNNAANNKTIQASQKVEAIVLSSNNSLSKTNTSVQVQANSKNKIAGNLLTPITAADMAGINSAGGQDGNSSKIMSQVAQALLLSGPAQSVQQNLLSPATSATPIITASIVNSPSSAASLTGPGVTPSINQLLPNTISSTRDSGTIVDGVNLDEMREFAKQFKLRRLSLGLTQTQVGQALSITEGPSYSQSAICRFEKLDITPKSAQKIKPVLERWMAMAEEGLKNGSQNIPEFIGLESTKKRKRRTSFTPTALELLNEHFEQSSHPSGTEMTELADRLNFDREVIRVWFCNKRQTMKNTIKKLKSHHIS